VLGDGRRRCARCRLDWRPGRLPLRLTSRQWRAIVGWFIRDVPADAIARETGVHRKRVLRALTVVRSALSRSLHVEDVSSAVDRSPADAPVIGLRICETSPIAELVPGLGAMALGRQLRPPADLVAEFPQLAAYVAIIWRAQLRWLRELPAGERGELSAFWAYLRRQLTARGGRRRARLGLFLAEFSWRYRFRKLDPDVQVQQVLKLVGGGEVSRVGLSSPVHDARKAPAGPEATRNGSGVNR
jgi:hypothetical protein